MKKILLNIVLLFSITTFAQNNIDRELLIQTPNCENVAYNSSRLIDIYFAKKNYDSINVVSNKWEEFCGATEPVFRLKVLSQIQSRQFSEEWMERDYLLNYIFLYLDRLDYSKESNSKLLYERYKITFGYIPLNSTFDDLTVVWANSLLENTDIKPIERAFCLLYSNQSDAFWQMLKDQKALGTKLQDVYAELVRKTNKKYETNLGLISGVFLPNGNLAQVIGAKALFGFQAGMKINKLQYDLSIIFKAGSPRQDYEVLYNNEIIKTDAFSSGYIGLDLAYQLSNNKKHEFDALGGIGYDYMFAVLADTEKNTDPLKFNSLNLNAGIGYRFYLKRMSYIGIQAKYNFIDFNNIRGTDLSGDYVSLILTYNFFGNKEKKTMIEKLKMQ
jgi:hypothetical protein